MIGTGIAITWGKWCVATVMTSSPVRREMMDEKAKVLVVDEEEIVRQSYQRSLADISFCVRTAPGGDEALGLMEEEQSDVILVDIKMPGMDGMELLRRIKERWPESEVVVITGYPSIETAKEAVRLGAHNYLSKPVGPKEVIEAATGAYVQKRWALRKNADAAGERPNDNRCRWEN